MPKRIVFTGVESTGKTSLAKELAIIYHSTWIPEFARIYCSSISKSYHYDDLKKIALGQIALSNALSDNRHQIIFSDTDLLTIIIWSEVKYGKCDKSIIEHFKYNIADYYFLCDMDFPWVFDEQRENPLDRMRIMKIYIQKMKEYNLNYQILSGNFNERISKIQNYIKSQYSIPVPNK